MKSVTPSRQTVGYRKTVREDKGTQVTPGVSKVSPCQTRCPPRVLLTKLDLISQVSLLGSWVSLMVKLTDNETDPTNHGLESHTHRRRKLRHICECQHLTSL